MTYPDVQSHKDYKSADLLTPRELAWEFLRRNKSYRREFTESKLLGEAELENRARRWRLQKPS